MSKISELSNGGALLSTDDLIVVRSGGNVRAQLSSLNGIAIGSSTPAAGSFTTLNTTGNISSTADIVLTKTGTDDAGIKFATAGANRYLASDENGVVAIGTGTTLMGGTKYLTIDSGNVGIGTSSVNANLEIRGSSSNGQVRLGGSTSGVYGKLYSDNDGVFIVSADAGNAAANSYFGVEVDGSERLRIDSSGRVGVGGVPNTNWRNDATDDVLMLGTEATLHSDAGVTTELWNNAYVDNSDTFKNISTRGASRYLQYSGAHKWFTAASASAGSTISTEINSSPKMVLDVNGSLGIGTSSIATNTKLHVKAGTNLNFEVENSSSTLRLSALNDARSANVPMQFASSSFQFITGNVNIGGTSGLRQFTVENTSNALMAISAGTSHQAGVFYYDGSTEMFNQYYDNSSDKFYLSSSASANQFVIDRATGSVGIGAAPDTTNYGGTFRYFGVDGGAGYAVIEGQTSSVTAGDGAASFFASTTGSSGLKLLGGMQVYNYASSASNAEGGLKFFTASGGSIPVRMTIKNTGYTVFGDGDVTTAMDSSGTVSDDQNKFGFSIKNTITSGSPYGLLVHYTGIDKNDTSHEFITCIGINTLRHEVRSNGGIANFQSNNANLCDEREKKNIEATASQWALVKGFDIKQFHYNDESDSDAKRLGVIAQEVEAYAPDLITDWQKQKARDEVLWEAGEDLPDGVSVGDVKEAAVEEISRKGVKEQQMMWMAIKALQEAQTRIETLEAEVAALKGA